MMAAKEVESGLAWKVKCQECKANLCGRGIESVPSAEKFTTDHAENTGHRLFSMDVLSHSISIEVIDAGKGEPCGMN